MPVFKEDFEEIFTTFNRIISDILYGFWFNSGRIASLEVDLDEILSKLRSKSDLDDASELINKIIDFDIAFEVEGFLRCYVEPMVVEDECPYLKKEEKIREDFNRYRTQLTHVLNEFYCKFRKINPDFSSTTTESNYSSLYLKTIFKETSKEYIDNFPPRLEKFLDALEATKEEYIQREIELFENCRFDIENPNARMEESSLTGAKTFAILYKVVNDIGLDKFLFATKRKCEFLRSLKKTKAFSEIDADVALLSLKKTLSGKSKEEKIISLNQIISNRGLGLDKPGQSSVVNDTYPETDIIKRLLLEIQDNPEAYESTLVDTALVPFVYDRNYDWFYNAKNILNQDLVFATVEYFENGPRENYFDPLMFLNLVVAQYDYVVKNIDKPHSTLTELKQIPLDDEKRHVLYGFILKWFGGYPVQNMDKQFNTTLRLIEKEFLNFKSDTPEKEFCQTDWDNYKRIKQIEGFINSKINGHEKATTSHQEPVISESTSEEIIIGSGKEPLVVPVYSTEDIPAFCGVLKPYFSIEDYTILERLLSSGVSNDKLLVFKGAGNALADAFKKVYDAQLIFGCTKVELEAWIARNFCYFSQGKTNCYTLKYLNDIISCQSTLCKRSILNINIDSGKKTIVKA